MRSIRPDYSVLNKSNPRPARITINLVDYNKLKTQATLVPDLLAALVWLDRNTSSAVWNALRKQPGADEWAEQCRAAIKKAEV